MIITWHADAQLVAATLSKRSGAGYRCCHNLLERGYVR